MKKTNKDTGPLCLVPHTVAGFTAGNRATGRKARSRITSISLQFTGAAFGLCEWAVTIGSAETFRAGQWNLICSNPVEL